MWEIRPEQAHKGHPAPFPMELPHRLIKLYTYPGDLILDPFVGSGTTCQAAELLARRWIGVDVSPNYVEQAMRNMCSTQRTWF